MLALTSAHRYLLRRAPTDPVKSGQAMRKGVDTLCGVVRDELGRDPLSGEVFVFIGARRDRIKLLLYEHGGYVLWYKRLERGTLELPRGHGAVKLTWGQLVLMIEGVPVQQPRTRLRWSPAAITTHC